MTLKLVEIGRETYGHDERAINRHSERRYRADDGRLFVLSKTLDGCPPFFEAYGPFTDEYRGLLPRLPIHGREYWGDGWSWKRAIAAFCREIEAEVKGPTPEEEHTHDAETGRDRPGDLRAR